MKADFRFRLSLLILTCIGTATGMAANLPTPAAPLNEPARFSTADFRQERHLHALDRALVSRGSISLSANGFIWQQREPFDNSLSFDGVSIVETTRMGTEQISRQIQDPATNSLTRVLFSMMNGSWEGMRSTFDIQPGTPTSDMSWVLDLIPRDETIRAVIPAIRVSGDHYVEQIRVQQRDADFTLIDLSNQRPAQ